MRIVVTTWGSLGDLYPYLAVARALRGRGHEVILGTAECYRDRVTRLGLSFAPVRPDCEWVKDPVQMRRIAHPRWGLIRAVRVPLACLRESYDDLDHAAKDADLIIANLAMYSARLVAEKRGLPWVSAMHIPTGITSAHDPPLFAGFPTLSRRLQVLGPTFWRVLRSLLKVLTLPLARPWYKLRRELGLPRARELNPLTDGHSSLLHLALFSPRLARPQPDWPASTVITGFPWYEPDFQHSLSPELERFLSSGAQPVVFSLGSALSADPGEFYSHSIRAAELLNHRAVLVPVPRQLKLPGPREGIFAADYAPFARLFPRAAVIVHHGGIGTTALALRAGRPMLVVPTAWDQPDNGMRAARLGVARVLSREQYEPENLARELRILLDDPTYAARATEVGREIAAENGAEAACDAVERAIFQAPVPRAPRGFA